MRSVIEKIENSPTGFYLWLGSFSAIITVRLFIENWRFNFRNRTGLFLFYEFTHTFLFFLIAYIVFLWILKKSLKIELTKISNILLWGYLIIIFPPVLDHLISRGEGYWSFYDFGSLKNLFIWFFTFFDKTPEMGITYGVRIEIIISLVFIFIYVLLKSNSHFQRSLEFRNLNLFKNLKPISFFKTLLKPIIVTLIAYLAFYILGTFPSWIAIAVRGVNKGFLKITDIDAAQMFLAPAKIFSREITDIASSLNIKMSLIYALFLTGIILIGLFFNFREKFISFLKNFRFPQLIYHWGLLLAGMGLAFAFVKTYAEINFFNIVSFLVSIIAISTAWLASVVVNDVHDQEIDKYTNKDRPLIKENFTLEQYKTLGWLFFFASILFSAIVNFKFSFFLIAYQAVAWIYPAWPFRLKRFAFLSTFVSAIALLIILFSGFILISPEQSIKNIPLPIISLLVIVYTLSLPIKDFKDIEGDKKDGVYTIPVLFGEQWGRIIVGSGVFLSFILSVIFLNEPRLFWWATIFGALSFWIVNSKKIEPARLPWWILGSVSLYGIILIKIIFL